MIRSAKMKLTTPPKLIPPFQRTAASGTFPTEQTQLHQRESGPSRGPITNATTGSDVAKAACSQDFGTSTSKAPAMSSPMAISRITAAQSITKYRETLIRPARRQETLPEPVGAVDGHVHRCVSLH